MLYQAMFSEAQAQLEKIVTAIDDVNTKILEKGRVATSTESLKRMQAAVASLRLENQQMKLRTAILRTALFEAQLNHQRNS